ncbi:MAG: methyltransferase domain-containing protein [Bacteroidales bacterium]|nr:methyltransferase domain-containing protein [Bacteroidales bacterium]
MSYKKRYQLKNLVKKILMGILGLALKSVNYFKLYKYVRISKYFSNKTGIELGGPSNIFMDHPTGLLPIYSLAKLIDGINFNESTIWEGQIEKGKTYNYFENKIGTQFIGEVSSLSSFIFEKYDFVLSSHCLEHCANPLKVIYEIKKILVDKGLLLIVVPNKEFTFDHKREVTNLEHLIRDFENNTLEGDLTHLDEILKYHDLELDRPAGSYENFRNRSLKNQENRCLHHHVFDLPLMIKIFKHTGFKVVFSSTKGIHHIVLGYKK